MVDLRRDGTPPFGEGPALTRGLNPLSALAWVRANAGTAGIARVLKRMSEEDLALLGDGGRGGLSARAWVPFSMQARLLRAIDAEHGRGDLTLLPDVGRFMSARDIPRVFRPFLKVGRPGWIVEMSTRLWRTYHSHGRWIIERTPHSVLATLEDHPEHDEAFCATLTGWMEGALAISGALDLESAHLVCAARGGSRCVFALRWTTRAHREDTERVRSSRTTRDR